MAASDRRNALHVNYRARATDLLGCNVIRAAIEVSAKWLRTIAGVEGEQLNFILRLGGLFTLRDCGHDLSIGWQVEC